MKKVIFLDIDGTLVDQRDGKEFVPKSAIKAIKETRKKGNYVYLCTGRSKPEIFQFILDIGVDGIIGAGGGYIESNGEVIFHEMLPNDVVKKIINYFNDNDFDYYLEANDGLYGSHNLIPRLKDVIYGDKSTGDKDILNKHVLNENPFIRKIETNICMCTENINKICFLEQPDIEFTSIVDLFKDDVTIHHCTVPVFGDNSGEFSLKDLHKAKAIEIVLSHLNISKENTYAYGDGLNDIEMLEYCYKGIAMANGKEQLKAIADEITDSVENDGLFNSMKKHGLI